MGGKVSKLILVARNNPGLYRTFLSNLKAGCSLASSCASIGISHKAAGGILSKVRKGNATRDERKIGRDIMQALGGVLALTEAEVRKLDPKYWLTHGPGRIITNEWNDDNNSGDNNDKTASNTISSKDITDALTQLYRCGISIDQLIESGQISTLQIGAASNSTSQLAPRLNQPTGEATSAGMGYGESSYGIKETNGIKESGHKPTESSYGHKNSGHNEPHNNSPNSTSTTPPNHLPVICSDKSYNPPPKLFVASEPVEIIDSIEEPPKPIVEGRRISRVPKVPGKVDSPDASKVSRDSLPVSDGYIGNNYMDLVGSQGISEVHPLVSLQGSTAPTEIGNLSGEGVSSQEDQGKGQIGQQAPVDGRKSRSPIAFTHDRNYDGPKIEKVSVMKVDPKSVPETAPESPGKKKVSSLPPTNADIAREQHRQKNEEMEEALSPLETLPDGLREFLSKKGIV